MILENPEEKSSISTNIENIDNEDKKFYEEKKNFQAISSNKEKQDLNIEDNKKIIIYKRNIINLRIKKK